MPPPLWFGAVLSKEALPASHTGMADRSGEADSTSEIGELGGAPVLLNLRQLMRNELVREAGLVC